MGRARGCGSRSRIDDDGGRGGCRYPGMMLPGGERKSLGQPKSKLASITKAMNIHRGRPVSAAARVPCCRPVDVRSKQRVFGKMKQQAGKGKAHEVYRVHPDNPSQPSRSQPSSSQPSRATRDRALSSTAQPESPPTAQHSTEQQDSAHRTD